MRRRWIWVAALLLLTWGWSPAVAGTASPSSYLILAQAGAHLGAVAEAVTAAGGQVLLQVPEIGLIQAAGGTQMAQAVGRLATVIGVARDPELALAPVPTVELAEPEPAASAAGALGPGDLYARYQWDIRQMTRDLQTFQVETGRRDVVVAVLDTGIDGSHPDLQAALVPGSRSFVPSEPDPLKDGHGHGTHVAGTIAANGRVYGLGPGLGLRAYKVLNSRGTGYWSWVLAGILYAAQDGSAVINLSLGGYAVLGGADTQEVALAKVALQRALLYAEQRGTVVVAAAGNSGLNLDRHGYPGGALFALPAGAPGVLAVSATDRHGALASYSNYGAAMIDLAAPGGDFPNYPQPGWWLDLCLSTYRGGRYAWMGGTSMAAPKVSAAAALVKARNPGITVAGIKHRLQSTATDTGKPGHDPFYGSGLLNLTGALAR